jgi:hypothetical protein
MEKENSYIGNRLSGDGESCTDLEEEIKCVTGKLLEKLDNIIAYLEHEDQSNQDQLSCV